VNSIETFAYNQLSNSRFAVVERNLNKPLFSAICNWQHCMKSLVTVGSVAYAFTENRDSEESCAKVVMVSGKQW